MMVTLIFEYFKVFPFSNLDMSRLYLISLFIAEGNSLVFLSLLEFKLFPKDVTPIYCFVVSAFLGFLAFRLFSLYFQKIILETD
jgi:hypothetical protein